MLPEGLLDSVRSRMRPATWCALRELERSRDECAWHHHAQAWGDFTRRHRRWRGEWSKTPELAEIGFDLLDEALPEYMRVEGCIWLTLFPSRRTAEAMAKVALDPSESMRVRDQAAWTLGFRQLVEADDAARWDEEAIRIADAALLALWHDPKRAEFKELMPALRHVASPEVLDVLADDVVAAAPALEAFATPKLAAALRDGLDEISHEHDYRLVRLVGDALGPESVPLLLAYAERAPYAVRIEALMTALALDAPRARPAVEAFLAGLTFDRALRERAAWHEAHPGVLPTVRALRVARTVATFAPEERVAACLGAANDFAGLGVIGAYSEQYLLSLWRRVAYRSRDDASIVEAVEADPKALEDAPYLVAPYLEALARAGRFDRLVNVARARSATAHATWLLAVHGRPFSALQMRRLATDANAEAVAGGALALFLAGRPDLAEASLARERPRCDNLPGEGIPSYPGPDETWRIANEPEKVPALVALAGGLTGLLTSLRGAPAGSDLDAIDFQLLVDREKDLAQDLQGKTVCIVGRLTETVAGSLRSQLEARGARIVDGPFAKTDYFLAAPGADPEVVGRLRVSGVRELPLP